MSALRSFFGLFLALVSILCLSATPAQAQQAIINLPSADITPKGRHFLMNESFFDKGVINTVNFYTYGVTDDTEACLTLYDLGKPQRDSLALGLGYKSRVVLDPEWEFQFTHGAMAPVNLRGNGLGIYGYGHFSGRIPELETRLTLGFATGTHHLFGRDTLCGLMALEQPITSELSFVVEHFTGSHELGNTIAGLVYHNHDLDMVFVAAYKFPNDPTWTSNGIVIEIGGFF